MTTPNNKTVSCLLTATELTAVIHHLSKGVANLSVTLDAGNVSDALTTARLIDDDMARVEYLVERFRALQEKISEG